MSAISNIVKNTFGKVFLNLAKEMDAPVENIQLGVYYDEKGNQKYEVYNQFKKEKDIDISEYVPGVVDWSGGTAVIETTIAQSGARYAKELNVGIGTVKIIMAYKKDCLPDAVLMAEGKKIRNVNIQSEILGE